jgi:hypothetical protein
MTALKVFGRPLASESRIVMRATVFITICCLVALCLGAHTPEAKAGSTPTPTPKPAPSPTDAPALDWEVTGQAISQPADSAQLMLALMAEIQLTNPSIRFKKDPWSGVCGPNNKGVLDLTHAEIKTRDDNYVLFEHHSHVIDLALQLLKCDDQKREKSGVLDVRYPVTGNYVECSKQETLPHVASLAAILTLANANNSSSTTSGRLATAYVGLFSSLNAITFPIPHDPNDTKYDLVPSVAIKAVVDSGLKDWLTANIKWQVPATLQEKPQAADSGLECRNVVTTDHSTPKPDATATTQP